MGIGSRLRTQFFYRRELLRDWFRCGRNRFRGHPSVVTPRNVMDRSEWWKRIDAEEANPKLLTDEEQANHINDQVKYMASHGLGEVKDFTERNEQS